MPHRELREKSHRSLSRKILKHDGVSFSARALWMLLETYTNDATWKCFPSIERLSKDSGHSRPWILRHLKELQEAGLVKVSKRKADEGWSNLYQLMEPD